MCEKNIIKHLIEYLLNEEEFGEWDSKMTHKDYLEKQGECKKVFKGFLKKQEVGAINAK